MGTFQIWTRQLTHHYKILTPASHPNTCAEQNVLPCDIRAYTDTLLPAPTVVLFFLFFFNLSKTNLVHFWVPAPTFTKKQNSNLKY